MARPIGLGEKPRLSLNITIPGFPVDTTVGWITNALRDQWSPEIFWEAFANVLNIKKSMSSDYQFKYIIIETIPLKRNHSFNRGNSDSFIVDVYILQLRHLFGIYDGSAMQALDCD